MDQASSLGSYSVLFSNVNLVNSQVGCFSYVQSNSLVFNSEVGNFCSIAGNVNIGLPDHPMHMVSTSPVFYDNSQSLPKFLIDRITHSQKASHVFIGSDVWIGYGAIIKAGIKIGVGAVVGAGAVVTKDIPPYAIVAGNPCRIIRYRFSEDIVCRLINSEWWKKDHHELQSIAHLFFDPLLFLESLEK
jgi:acetyltransferase-like isoleucine patch superfamily enzyme